MFKLNAKFDTALVLFLVSNFECNDHTVHMLFNGAYCPHWLVQWSHHCSRMHIPVPSHWLPGYIDAMQIILVILTMAGLFWTDLIHTLESTLDAWADYYVLCSEPASFSESPHSPGPHDQQTSPLRFLLIYKQMVYFCLLLYWPKKFIWFFSVRWL